MSSALAKAELAYEARTLSSGTIATCCRQSLLLSPKQSAEYRWIEAVQFAFTRFCATDARIVDCSCWQDAWQAYARWVHHVRNVAWKCGYRGETEYLLGGESFSVRWSAHHDPLTWSPGELEHAIKPAIGTITRSYGKSKGFPPADVCAAFPGIVPAMWRGIPGQPFGELIYHPDYQPPTYHEAADGKFLRTDFYPHEN